MAFRMRGSASFIALAIVSMTLAGCASSNNRDLNIVGQVQPQQLAPVQDSTVAQNQLPPLGGVEGAPAPGLTGQPVLGGVQTQQTASADGSFVSLDPLAGGVSSGPEGVWTAISGTSQCRVNLPLTAREGTTRYRASAPGCAVPGLASVGSWQQVGSQIQLFDEAGTLVAALAQSGPRYIGTLAGGQAISLQR